MKTRRSFTLTLRWSAAAILVVGLVVWAATGASLGWTQTSRVTMQHDEITGIEYPVRTPAFIAGVEVPLAGAAAAALLGALSFLPQLRAAKQH